MTDFNELFVDIDSYRPASKWQSWVRELMVWLMALILFLSGWFFREWILTQFR